MLLWRFLGLLSSLVLCKVHGAFDDDIACIMMCLLTVALRLCLTMILFKTRLTFYYRCYRSYHQTMIQFVFHFWIPENQAWLFWIISVIGHDLCLNLCIVVCLFFKLWKFYLSISLFHSRTHPPSYLLLLPATAYELCLVFVGESDDWFGVFFWVPLSCCIVRSGRWGI